MSKRNKNESLIKMIVAAAAALGTLLSGIADLIEALK